MSSRVLLWSVLFVSILSTNGVADAGLHPVQFQVQVLVLDEAGNPLEDARTFAVSCCRPIKGRFFIRYANTGPDGRCVLTFYRPDTYDIHSDKKDAGYPDTWLITDETRHYRPNPEAFKRVRVSVEHPSASVTLKLGPKLRKQQAEP